MGGNGNGLDFLRIVEFLLALSAFGMIVVGAIFWLRAEKVRQDEDRATKVNAELEQLVDVRGERIADLETALQGERKERLAEVQNLREEIAELRGQMELMRSLKAEEIAASVVEQADAIAEAVVSLLKEG
jgi:hypothetical protein